MWRLAVILFFTLHFVACSFNDYNSSVYPYQFNADLANKPMKTVMILPINFYKPSRHYLQKYEALVDDSVQKYLKAADYTILSNRSFQSLWQKSHIDYGNTFNPSTGELTSAFKPALKHTLEQLFKQHPSLDAVIFTDLIEQPLQYSNASKKSAQWNGVVRKVKIEGVGEDVTEEFDWKKVVDGISISIHVLNREQELMQHSIGGIQIAQSIKLNNKKAKFGRRHDLLAKEKEIDEGIALAFHPWIKMKRYPGKK
jgi:hypothetical protein